MQTIMNNHRESSSSSLQAQNIPAPAVRPEASDADSVTDINAAGYEDRNGQHHPIAEFLYQLTKMLTDDNTEVIEWADGRIKVHSPERLENEVLHKYFRHSKFASFQRQLNYFGFRKIAGKGKMSPCSYVNENASSDIRSLLLIKRKTNGSAARKAALQQRAAAVVNPAASALSGLGLAGLNPALLSGQQLSNAMALLSENAFRAGIGQMPSATPAAAAQLNLLALQQQQQQLQKQLLEQQNALAQQMSTKQQLEQMEVKPSNTVSFAPNVKQENDSNSNFLSASTAASLFGNMANMEQLQAQLRALQNSQQSNVGRATAALNSSMPATAAMDAAATTAPVSLFDSVANLKKFFADSENSQAQLQADQQSALLAANRNQLASSLSLGNFLQSSNRLSSLLSLNSFLGSASREASLADFSSFPSNVREQLAAAAAVNNSHPSNDMNKFR